MTFVRLVNEIHVVKVAFLLLRLLRENVTMESVMSLDFTRSSKRKTLFRTGISLYFWHFLCVLIDEYTLRLREIPNATR